MSDYDNKEIPRPLKLEAMVESTPQSEGVDVTLVDAMVVLQTMVNLPDHVWRSSTPAVAEAVWDVTPRWRHMYYLPDTIHQRCRAHPSWWKLSCLYDHRATTEKTQGLA